MLVVTLDTLDALTPLAPRTPAAVGPDPQISLMDEGLEGLARLGGIADGLLLRQGGCPGCGLSGTCGTCMPLVTLYRKAKAPWPVTASREGGKTR